MRCEHTPKGSVSEGDTTCTSHSKAYRFKEDASFVERCNKKLSLIDMELKCTAESGAPRTARCKCHMVFCSKHRHSFDHNCTFNYQEQQKEILRKTLTRNLIDSKRIIKI